MGIAVKKGDVLILVVNGITANTIRANVGFRPDSWWYRVFNGLSKMMLGTTDPHNLTVDVVSTTDRSAASGLLVITEDGEIDTAMIENISGTIPAGPGEIYAWLRISRSDNNSAWFSICRGYVHQTNSPVFPWDGGPAGPFDGPGRMFRTGGLGDPAAGADYAALTVPTNARWKHRGIHGQLVTAVAAANREWTIEYKDTGGNLVAGVVATEVQPASLTDDYLGIAGGVTSSGVSSALAGGAIQIGLGDLWLPAGFTINPTTFNIQGADNWGAGDALLEEWIDP